MTVTTPVKASRGKECLIFLWQRAAICPATRNDSHLFSNTWLNIYIAFTQSAVSMVTISSFLFSLKFCTLCYIKERRFVRLQKSLGHDGGDRLSIVDCVDINYNKSSPIHRKKLNLSIWDHNISNEFKIIIKSVTTRSISKIETDLLTSLRSLRALRLQVTGSKSSEQGQVTPGLFSRPINTRQSQYWSIRKLIIEFIKKIRIFKFFFVISYFFVIRKKNRNKIRFFLMVGKSALLIKYDHAKDGNATYMALTLVI